MIPPNSSARSTAWNGIPSEAATMRASRASPTEQQDFLRASVSVTWTPLRMNRPTSSSPSRASSQATTELSTPPLMATTARFPRGRPDRGSMIRREIPRSGSDKLRPRATRGQGRFGWPAWIGYRARPQKTTMTLLFLSLFQEGTATPPASPAPSFLSGNPLVPLLIVGALFFFLLILPERKKQKQRTQMLDALKKGDRVMTSGGLYGTVVTTTSEVVVLQVADNVRLRFSRAAVQTIVEAEKEPAL